MSNAIFPTLPGLDIAIRKTPEFSTSIQASRTGKELRVAHRLYPIWNMQLKANFLRDTVAFPELRSLGGFYLARLGPADSFLILDSDDSSVTDTSIGAGNAVATDFQLLRAFGTFVEPIFNPLTVTNVKVNGVSVGFSQLANGVIRCDTAPANGTSVTWTGTYYFRARFDEDKMDFERFLNQVWAAQRIALVASLQDKI